jgi:HAE1 family hydrophobic/amphiphilic exporter-1
VLNGVVMVSYINRLVDEGRSIAAAIVEGASVRLRPVLMTQIATICGMIPVALSNSDGAEWRNALGYLIIGGLASSTILTLLVVPAAFMVPEDVKAGAKRALSFLQAVVGGARRRVDKKQSAPAE